MQTFVDNGANGYGLGVIRYRPFGIDFVGHAGNTIGYSSFVVCSDERGICVAALVNQNAKPAHSIVFALIERILAFQSTATSAEVGRIVAATIELHHSYPNPASISTTIAYTLGKPGPIRLTVHDLLGRKIAVLDEGAKIAGDHQITVPVSDLPVGHYLYSLNAAGLSRWRILTIAR